MKMIYKVSNKLSDIKSTIENLKNNNPINAFISYVDGEYGMRTLIYNSHVKDFVYRVKNNNEKTFIIGICFINHTIFLKDMCDCIIEIQDTKFEDSELKNIDDHTPNFLTNIYYNGNDGWSNYYLRGLYSNNYENMLNDFNFENIFFTTHCDGSSIFNHEGDMNREFNTFHLKIIGKINNKHHQSLPNLFPKPVTLNPKTNEISLHIRNTTKWPEKNLSEEIYKTVFNFCIDNKITLNVFLDLNPVEIPESEYIKIHNSRVNNIPNIDYYMKLISNSNMFIGCISGFSEMVSYYTNTPNIFINGRNWVVNPSRDIIIFNGGENLNNLMMAKI